MRYDRGDGDDATVGLGAGAGREEGVVCEGKDEWYAG